MQFEAALASAAGRGRGGGGNEVHDLGMTLPGPRLRDGLPTLRRADDQRCTRVLARLAQQAEVARQAVLYLGHVVTGEVIH